MNRRTSLMLQGHAVVGIALSTAVFVATIVVNLLQPAVDPLHDPVSNLALGHGGLIIDAAFVAGGLGTVALAVALRRLVVDPTERAPTALAQVGGFAIAALSFFPTDPDPMPTTWVGWTHSVLASGGFVSLAIAFAWFSRILARHPGWTTTARWLSILSRIGIGLVVFTASAQVVAMAGHERAALMGLLERCLIGAQLGWTLVASLRLAREVV